ncbi:MAG: RNA polymerase sigma factor, partial [Gaiellaceae bacterium]
MVFAPRDEGDEDRSACALVRAHRDGDPDAFAEIVRLHYRPLLSIARRQLGGTVDAEDALQETFLRAFLALDRFGGTGEWRLGAWLRTILLRVCADIPERRGR